MIADLRKHNVDLLGGGLLTVLGTVCYILFLHSALADSLRQSQVDAQHREASEAVTALQKRSRAVRCEIDEGRTRLASLNSKLPDDHALDKVISRLQVLASECDVVLLKLHPARTDHTADYQVTTLLVDGRGTFPAIRRYFGSIEVKVPYLDVTHFDIRRASEKSADPTCQFECTTKFYFSAHSARTTALASTP
jgi:hypothetical protein